MLQRTLVGLGAAIALSVAAQPASAGFISYVIRSTPTVQTNNVYTPGATEFIIGGAGQKAALGSSDADGATIGDIVDLSITRWDDRTRFTAGSGPYVAPYFNLWITDGAGRFAVVANEPSNPDFQALYNNGYSLSFADLADKPAKIHENTDKSWLPNNGVGLTFADLAGFIIQAPTVADLSSGWAGLGGGAPRELGTNIAYGVNWVFGDTLANYVSGPSNEGYVVSDAQVRAAVPEPAMLALFGLGLVTVARKVRGRR